MAPPQEVLSSLKHHSLILRPILCKSAVVIFIIDNNYLKRLIPIILLSLQGSLSKMRGPKKKSCIYFTTFPCIHSFPWSDQITTCVFFKTYFILVNKRLQVVRSVASASKFNPVTVWWGEQWCFAVRALFLDSSSAISSFQIFCHFL